MLIIVDYAYKGFSYIICLTIVTLILIATFRPQTAGLHRAIVSIHWFGLFVPPWLLVIGCTVSTVEPRYDKGPRDWQNMFVITRLVNLYRGSFSYCFICYSYWSKKKSSLVQRLRYRSSTVRYIFIYLNSIFVGIRTFQHLKLLLVRLDPISLMRSKAQNAYLYKTALSLRLPRFQTSKQGRI